MSEDDPITFEQHCRLSRVASEAIENGAAQLGQEDAAALRALLRANEYWGEVRRINYSVSAGADRKVRLTVAGVQHYTAHVTIPMEMDPEIAEKIAEELESAASFARMAIVFDPDALKDGL